jgi:hypothetical protein
MNAVSLPTKPAPGLLRNEATLRKGDFLCSDPAPHPLTKQLLWRTHRHWTLACQWPNHTLHMEETACGCGVRVTVGFDEGFGTGTLPELEEPGCGEWSG